MILTQEIWQSGKSSNNGWNGLQLKVLGVDKLYKGWAKELIGKDFDESVLKKFVELKDYHFKTKIKSGLPINKKTADKMGIVQFEPIFGTLNYKEQYLHPNWQKIRLFVFNRDNYTCVDCKSKDKTLHAHHLKYNKGKYIWEVPVWYLVTLCEDCHSKEHGRDLTIKK